MADHPGFPDDDEAAELTSEPARIPGRPGWLAVAGIALAVGLLVVFVILHLTGVLGPGSH